MENPAPAESHLVVLYHSRGNLNQMKSKTSDFKLKITLRKIRILKRGSILVYMWKIDYRALNPIPRPFPLSTFPMRIVERNLQIVNNLFRPIAIKIHIVGSRIKEIKPTGNILLELNSDYAIGNKGFTIEVPPTKAFMKICGNLEVRN